MDKEFFLVTGTFATVILLIMTVVATISYNDNEAVVKMVQAGAHPLDARCAVGGGTKEVCALRAVKHE